MPPPVPLWNDAIAPGDDVTSAAYHNKFNVANAERGNPITAVVAGTTDVQSVGGASVRADCIGLLIQHRYIVSPPVAGDPYVPTGFPASAVELTWDAVLADTDFTPPAASIKDTVLGGNGWPIRYDREFLRRVSGGLGLPASTAYIDGAAFANGHVARCLADGKIYSRTAGAWVRVRGVPPDYIDVFDAEDLTAGYAFTFDFPDGHAHAYRAERFNAVRDVLNVMTWVLSTQRITAASYTVWNGSGTGATWAAAQAAAVADFQNRPSGLPGFGFPSRATSSSAGSLAGGVYTASLSAVSGSYVFGNGLTGTNLLQARPGRNLQYVLWLVGEAANAGDPFDGNGSGFLEDQWSTVYSELHTGAVGTGSYPSHFTIGNNAQPAWCAAPTVGVSTSRGYAHKSSGGFLVSPVVTVDGDVPGGFEYTATSTL